MVAQKPLRLDPEAVYREAALVGAGIPGATIKQARETGRLRFTRQGNRILYLGKWVLAWLESEVEAGDGRGVPR